MSSLTFYHGTDEETAKNFATGMLVEALAKGEFGKGFYTLVEQAPAQILAEEYTPNRPQPHQSWGVVAFTVPSSVLVAWLGVDSLGALMSSSGDQILIFPDKVNAVDVKNPSVIGDNVIQKSWKQFYKDNTSYRKQYPPLGLSWPYSLVVGPMQKPPLLDPNQRQFLFTEYGIGMLNDKQVTRAVVAQGLI